MKQSQIFEWKKPVNKMIGNTNKQFMNYKMNIKKKSYALKFMEKQKISKVQLVFEKQMLKILYGNYY